MKKIYETIKIVIHTILAIILFIFAEKILPNVAILVGLIMFLYSIETFVGALSPDSKHKDQRILESILLILFGIIMLTIGKNNFLTACIVWATWSLYREGMELINQIKESNKLWVGILNVIESLITIVFSIMLIANPAEHHALTHIYLLGVELLCAIYLHILDKIKINQ